MIDLSVVQNERDVITGGIKALEQAKAAFDRKGITIVISGIHTQPYLLLEKTGMADKLGRENIYDNINSALNRARELIGTEAKSKPNEPAK